MSTGVVNPRMGLFTPEVDGV
uniref:Uncharacterized protein n=1 Tax=Cryptococcus bacillisporus CA1280 TaxID=1296109 RepID=A0A0D0TPK4_CRYGA|nr:hypothetical protein I312_01666 [Cryptococcus bacillisporus CA1280]